MPTSRLLGNRLIRFKEDLLGRLSTGVQENLWKLYPRLCGSHVRRRQKWFYEAL